MGQTSARQTAEKMTITVSREPLFSNPRSSREIAKAGVAAQHGNMEIGFTTPRGTGKSCYNLIVEPEDFTKLARAMLQANPEEAIKAFGTALQEGIPEPARNGKYWIPNDPSRDAA